MSEVLNIPVSLCLCIPYSSFNQDMSNISSLLTMVHFLIQASANQPMRLLEPFLTTRATTLNNRISILVSSCQYAWSPDIYVSIRKLRLVLLECRMPVYGISHYTSPLEACWDLSLVIALEAKRTWVDAEENPYCLAWQLPQ